MCAAKRGINRKKTLLDLLRIHSPQKTREELYADVLSGLVSVLGHTERDPQALYPSDSVPVYNTPCPYVSRGGLKLEGFLRQEQISPQGLCILDLGASTGGFSDCLLHHGAAHVHAVDVGKNQLAYKLRQDMRVSVYEKTSFSSILWEDLVPSVDWAVADLSFRSILGVWPSIKSHLKEQRFIALVKPQFEWKNAPSSFKGYVPFEALEGILQELLKGLAQEGLVPYSIRASVLKGRGGNQEFFFDLRPSSSFDHPVCFSQWWENFTKETTLKKD